MTLRSSPTEPNPTHHVILRDRKGTEVGLILTDSQGNLRPNFARSPIDRTSLKTTSGSLTYSDFDYPYSPIAQDDWSGGRAGLDFERDSTKYYDANRIRTGRSNKAFLGPQETYATGHRSIDQNMPGNVTWHVLTDSARWFYKSFTASASYTAGLLWLLARRVGTPGDLTLAIYSDSAGSLGALLTSATVDYTRTEERISEWISETVSQALTASTTYWVVAYGDASDDADNRWEVGVNATTGSSYYSDDGAGHTASDTDLYFRVTEANTEKRAIFYEYKEVQYVVISGTSGAPKLYINGDRGTADSNAGSLNKLIDATKAWTTNEWTGCVVMITDGTGKLETTTYRTITSNTSNQLVVSEDFTIQHDTTTEYAIFGSSKFTEMTGHNMTAPVTDVQVVSDIVYFCQGDSTNIRRHREYTLAGVWTTSDWADDGTNKATFLTLKPQANKIFRANNSDGSTNVSVSSADPVAWGVNLTFGTAANIGSKYRKITGIEVYPDDSGVEALWVFKTDIPWIVPSSGNPYPIQIREMENLRSDKNGKALLVHNVYLYFSFTNSLERYYAGNIDDIGPNGGEGLPADRQGPVSSMVGYAGKFFASIDAGSTGYSSILDREGNGYHERYRAPYGQRIHAMTFQVVPGTKPDRLWVYQGNDILFLPSPSDTTNELEDSEYTYTHEGHIVLSRMHAGMFDVQKLVKTLKLWTDQLDEDTTWIEADYRLDADTDWTAFEELFKTSPVQAVDLTPTFGLAAKRIQLRLRFYTADNTQTPILLATILEAVSRVAVKDIYQLTFRVADKDKTLIATEDDPLTADEKIQILSDWADDTTDSMLYMSSTSPLYHGRYIFLNPANIVQIQSKHDTSNESARDVYIMTTTIQDA